MREFDTWRDPYGNGYSTCKPRKICIEKGLTVLIGCNGSGKSTLLQNLEDKLKQAQIPVVLFDDFAQKSNNDSIKSTILNHNLALTAALLTSSEGEAINLRLSQFAANLLNFIDTGTYSSEDSESILIQLLKKDQQHDDQSRERWILLDGIDSGYSIDNIVELKQLFKVMEKDAATKHIDLYIVVAANAYELARKSNCFDVQLGKYVTFTSYEDYRSLILKTRKLKRERIERAIHNNEIKYWKLNHGE